MKTLRVRDDTHKELSELGVYGETMDDIIKKVVDFYKQNKK